MRHGYRSRLSVVVPDASPLGERDGRDALSGWVLIASAVIGASVWAALAWVVLR